MPTSMARGLAGRWRSTGRWARFAVVAGLTLVVTAFLPTWRLPGPRASTSLASTTTTSGSPPTFPFDGDEFIKRWNSVAFDDSQLEAAFDVSGSAADGATLTVSNPDIGVDWKLTVAIDALDGGVRKLSLISPLAADTDMSIVGALVLISAVEGVPIEDAAMIWDALTAPLDDMTDDEPVSLRLRTGAAEYRLAISPTTQFLFEASP